MYERINRSSQIEYNVNTTDECKRKIKKLTELARKLVLTSRRSTTNATNENGI